MTFAVVGGLIAAGGAIGSAKISADAAAQTGRSGASAAAAGALDAAGADAFQPVSNPFAGSGAQGGGLLDTSPIQPNLNIFGEGVVAQPAGTSLSDPGSLFAGGPGVIPAAGSTAPIISQQGFNAALGGQLPSAAGQTSLTAPSFLQDPNPLTGTSGTAVTPVAQSSSSGFGQQVGLGLLSNAPAIAELLKRPKGPAPPGPANLSGPGFNPAGNIFAQFQRRRR